MLVNIYPYPLIRLAAFRMSGLVCIEKSLKLIKEDRDVIRITGQSFSETKSQTHGDSSFWMKNPVNQEGSGRKKPNDPNESKPLKKTRKHEKDVKKVSQLSLQHV